MLTYAELKKALAQALDISLNQGRVPVAIIKRGQPRGWWDKWNDQSYSVVLHTPDLTEDQIIVGGIVADLNG